MRRVGYCAAGVLMLLMVMLCGGCERAEGEGRTSTQSEAKAETEEKPLQHAEEKNGYLSVCPYGMGFAAVGSAGKIAIISPEGGETVLESGIQTALYDIVCQETRLVAVGEKGAVLLSLDGKAFQKQTAGTGLDLYTTLSFNGQFLCGGQEGVLLSSEDGVRWRTTQSGTKGSIVSLTATDGQCLGVTDKGEILTSADGFSWSVLDYGAYYQEQAVFYQAASAGQTYYVIGAKENGAPLLIESTGGSVWSQRELNFVDGTPADLSKLRLSDIIWDGQQAVAAGSDGSLLTLPSCTQCNKLQKIADVPLWGIAYNGGRLAAVGKDGFAKVITTDAVRQYKISADEALKKQRNGAVIIDVRSSEEYQKKHVKGSIQIALDRVKEQLPRQLPDKNTELIFYCSKGVRSQTALEVAKQLGYQNVYSLGGLDDWRYETEGSD